MFNTKDEFNEQAQELLETKTLEVTSINGFALPQYDYIGASYPTTTSEVYEYKDGGSSGTTVAIFTVVYTDTTKSVLSSVTKT